MTNRLENSNENKPPNLLKEEQAKEQYSLANCGLHNHPLQGGGGLLKEEKIMTNKLENSNENKPPNLLKEEQAKEQHLSRTQLATITPFRGTGAS